MCDTVITRPTNTHLNSASACWALYSLERYHAVRHGHKDGRFELIVHKESLLKPESGYAIWIIPALLEFAAGWFCNLAMSITYASTVLMLRTFNTAVVAFITTVWLKTPLKAHHWYGVIIVTLGTCIAALFAILVEDPDTPYTRADSYLGAVAALVSCVFSSLKVCCEEKFLKDYRLAPFKAAGIQGIYQVVVAGAMLIFSWNSLPVKAATYQLRHSSQLQKVAWIFVSMIFLFNASLIVIAKLSTSLLRTVLEVFRTVLVYLMELQIGWSTFHYLDLTSVITSTLGLLVYINVIPTPNAEKIVTGHEEGPASKATELASATSQVGIASALLQHQDV
eukprot:Blabericola_migrator_1__3434@NODE_200_length_11466_cov_45_966751_g172_i0_p3_GENE_NODE_200_length_11466_cov_45_966751_g172_i0NODE_200_length_11466_cov_45_966751_g172_i0_p3_ORF_typecomplete_len337_score68_84SLC35F/PF06027_12/1_1e22Nuc_sug_transp/PF04142_15/1_5e17CRTlike/PF08627_10/3_1e17TPT/PF03151_16/7_7e13PUNUT/PF16913_5/3_3e11UAA/PF08449_11/6e10Mg_trans_NIPA/PF05653_14/0_00047EamA/PF00892_20/1_2e04EamA/PF00892_20/0_00078EamA/PF00892_20/1_2e03MENTAL/PF10457_9/0_2MENTAL/PF10457_9/5_1e02_NODE_200_